MNTHIWIEFKLEDFWIGAFWKVRRFPRHKTTNIWICLVPCFPICIEIHTPTMRDDEIFIGDVSKEI